MDKACHRALVGLGSNLEGPLGQPADYLHAALHRLDEMDGLQLLRSSGFYTSLPWGKCDQAVFVNAVAEIHCQLSPDALLEALLKVEGELGRERGEKWGPRLIDLDLLCFDDLQIQRERLEIPHPYMHQRAFVLVPLLELFPDFYIPGKGRADQFLAELGKDQSVELL